MRLRWDAEGGEGERSGGHRHGQHPIVFGQRRAVPCLLLSLSSPGQSASCVFAEEAEPVLRLRTRQRPRPLARAWGQ